MSAKPHRTLFWPLIAWAAILLLNFFFTPGFFQVAVRDGHLFGSLVDIFVRGTPVLLISLGMTFVIATGGVDLSVGAITAISGALAATLFQKSGMSVGGVVVQCLGIAILAGCWNAFLVAIVGVQPIVATLVLMVAGRGIGQLLTGGAVLPIESEAYHELGTGYWLGVPIPFWVVLVMFGVAAVLSRRTALGLFIEAVGNNPVASRYAGVNTRAVKAFTYIFCGLCSGVAGVMISSNIGAADANTSGLYLELDAILAVVIGGTALQGGKFSLTGSLIGALIIQTVVTTVNTRGVQAELTLIIKAVVVIAVCLLQSPAFRKTISSLRIRGRGRAAS